MPRLSTREIPITLKPFDVICLLIHKKPEMSFLSLSIWEKCLSSLEGEFPSQQFNTWIRPLQAEYTDGKLVLLAPNRFVLDWIVERFLTRINELVTQFSDNQRLLLFPWKLAVNAVVRVRQNQAAQLHQLLAQHASAAITKAVHLFIVIIKPIKAI